MLLDALQLLEKVTLIVGYSLGCNIALKFMDVYGSPPEASSISASCKMALIAPAGMLEKCQTRTQGGSGSSCRYMP